MNETKEKRETKMSEKRENDDGIIDVQYGDGFYITIEDIVDGGEPKEDFLTPVEISDGQFAQDPCSCDICGTPTIEMYSSENNQICGKCLEAAYLRINKYPLD